MQVVDVQQLAHSSHAHSHVPLKAFLCFQKDVPMLAHDRNRTFSHFGTPQTLIMFNVMLLLPIHLRCRWVDSFEVLKIILVPNRLKMLFSKFCSGRLRCDLIYKNSLYKEQSRPDINSNLNTSISDDNKGQVSHSSQTHIGVSEVLHGHAQSCYFTQRVYGKQGHKR